MTPTHKPLTALHVRPAIETSLFDFFKIGPGPSSSHTIGPMRAGHDFVQRCDALDPDLVRRAARIHVVLLGSLSATGMGHGTNTAVLAGLLRTSPETCPAGLLDRLGREADARHELRIHDVLLQVGLADIEHGPIIHDAPYSNTLLVSLEDADGQALFSMEYYSVGGGFIQWKGWTPPERGKPVHPYGTMRQLREQLVKTGLTLHELILDNESSITGMSRPDIFQNLEQIMESMYASVRRGLEAEGQLPGTLGVWRKGHTLLERAREMPLAVDRFLGQVNAYAFAVAEENASGGVIVTAPTCGAAGVMPALLYAMRYNMNIGDRALREGVLASAAVGFLAKHNAGIAGAEVGCQGEVGVASSMAAAMLAHARGYAVDVVENAAEVALEHHLGLTCDPVGGYVQIPCIERNAVGAIKAYNACLLATCEKSSQHMVSLDAVIMAMNETGREMNAKFKETSEGGLAVSLVECGSGAVRSRGAVFVHPAKAAPSVPGQEQGRHPPLPDAPHRALPRARDLFPCLSNPFTFKEPSWHRPLKPAMPPPAAGRNSTSSGCSTSSAPRWARASSSCPSMRACPASGPWSSSPCWWAP